MLIYWSAGPFDLPEDQDKYSFEYYKTEKHGVIKGKSGAGHRRR